MITVGTYEITILGVILKESNIFDLTHSCFAKWKKMKSYAPWESISISPRLQECQVVYCGWC